MQIIFMFPRELLVKMKAVYNLQVLPGSLAMASEDPKYARILRDTFGVDPDLAVERFAEYLKTAISKENSDFVTMAKLGRLTALTQPTLRKYRGSEPDDGEGGPACYLSRILAFKAMARLLPEGGGSMDRLLALLIGEPSDAATLLEGEAALLNAIEGAVEKWKEERLAVRQSARSEFCRDFKAGLEDKGLSCRDRQKAASELCLPVERIEAFCNCTDIPADILEVVQIATIAPPKKPDGSYWTQEELIDLSQLSQPIRAEMPQPSQAV